MKTMNKIYRTLLVAVAAVMGVNSADAQAWSINFDGKTSDNNDIEVTISETVVTIGEFDFGTVSWGSSSEESVWTGNAGPDYNFITPSYQDFVDAGADEDLTLRIYATIANENSWGIILQSSWSSSLGFKNWQGQDDGKTINNGNYSIYDAVNGCFDVTIGSSFLSTIQQQGTNFQNWGLNITGISIYSGNGISLGNKFVLQTETKWLLRPESKGNGLYSFNSGGRSFGIRDCKAGQVITINASAEMKPTTNAQLKSEDGTTYKYVVQADGDVSFRPDRYVTIHSISIVDGYSVTYKIGDDVHKVVWYEAGDTITPEADLEREGYTFSGWKDFPEDMLMPASNIIVKGAFDVNHNDIMYMVDGNDYHGYYYIAYGTTLSPDYIPDNPTKEGYLFDHWEGLPETMPDSLLKPVAVFVVDPDYEDPKYALIYYIDNVPYDTVYYEEGATVTAIADPTRKGYTFNGWQNVPATMPAYTVNAYGSFTKITFAVTYKIGDDVLRVDSVNTGDPIVPPTVDQREHYTFAWGYYPQTMGNQDVLVTGTYTAIPTHDLIYYVDGQEYKRFTIEEGAAITPEAEPERRGFTFSGWSTIPTVMPNYDYGVYGSFSATIIDTYPIYYQVDGYTIYTERLAEGETPNPPATASKTGYTFIKWSGVPETMPAEAVTVTAQFSVNSYTLTYTLDGEAYGEPETIEYGAPITAKANPADREGYTFSGWLNLPTTMPAQNVTVSGTFYKDKEFINISVGTMGYNTFSAPYPVKFQGTESIKAYIATAKSDTEVTLTRVIGNIAAGTGLVLIGEAGATAQIETAETGSSYSDNLLVGVTNSPAIINAANLYVLVNKSGTVKFADTAGNAATVPVGKAYLETSAGARILSIFFDEDTTGLSGIAVQENWNDQPVYDLRGQRVTTPKKGLYLINGKKVFVK
jgi:hypothetical protein